MRDISVVGLCEDDTATSEIVDGNFHERGGCHGGRREIRVSHRRDEDDDVAPFGWLNY